MVLRVCLGILHDIHAAEDAFQATFLILARKAGHHSRIATRSPSWLFGVARRVSIRARTERSRRAALEQNDPAIDRRPTPPRSPTRRSLMPEIQYEIDRLPEKYRAPVILCYLEGMTHEEAAGQLRLPVGTVKTRLSRARDRLRGPLLRRGLAPAVISTWMQAEARAAPPRQLVNDTVQAVIQITSGRAAGVSAPIADPCRRSNQGHVPRQVKNHFSVCELIFSCPSPRRFSLPLSLDSLKSTRSSNRRHRQSRLPKPRRPGRRTERTDVSGTRRPSVGISEEASEWAEHLSQKLRLFENTECRHRRLRQEGRASRRDRGSRACGGGRKGPRHG